MINMLPALQISNCVSIKQNMIELRNINAKILLVLSSFCAISNALKNGDPCTAGRKSGICKPIVKCNYAIRNHETVTYCDKATGLTCCIEDDGTRSTRSSDGCPPFEKGQVKATKTESIAWNKCIDFAEHIYHCENLSGLIPQKVRINRCNRDAKPIILDGTLANHNEFPHMASLGYEDEKGISWECGGSLISERWVLTAAHCNYNLNTRSSVTKVRLGGTSLSDTVDDKLLFDVEKVEIHPDFKFPKKYNDIALIKLSRDVETSAAVIPACLHTGNIIDDDKLIACGYGKNKRTGYGSNDLQKVTLEKFTPEECSAEYPANRGLPEGLKNESQYCAGHHTENKDTCHDYSGGPLQIKNDDAVACSYLIVGLASAGKGCGIIGTPGIYTRVSYYIPWIESIVWP